MINLNQNYQCIELMIWILLKAVSLELMLLEWVSKLQPSMKDHIVKKTITLLVTGKNGLALTELKWKMLKNQVMVDQLSSRLDISKFLNVLILLLNKWNKVKLPMLAAHKISIKEVISKTYIEMNIMETIGYKTQLQPNISLQFRNVPSNHIT